MTIAEGLRIVTEAVEAGMVPRMIVYASEARDHPVLRRVVTACESAGGDAIETTPDILSKLASKDNPQAVLGVFPIAPAPLAGIDRHSSFAWIVCQSLKDPGNLGTILRTGDAVGAGGLILVDDCAEHTSWKARVAYERFCAAEGLEPTYRYGMGLIIKP